MSFKYRKYKPEDRTPVYRIFRKSNCDYMLLLVSRAPNLQRVVAQLVALGEASRTGKRLRWSVDVDPLEM